MEYVTYQLECKCGTKLIVEATIKRGYSDHEIVQCPTCKDNVQEIRADMGYEVVEVIKP